MKNPSSPGVLPSKLIFVPGAGCQIEDYPKTYVALEGVGFDVVAISPPWNDDTPFEELVNHVVQEVVEQIDPNTLVVAHSRGANLVMPALIQQPHIGAILASPSMTCAEGYDNDTARPFAEARFPNQEEQVRNIGMFTLARASEIPPERATVLVGGQERVTYPFMYEIATAAARGFGIEVIEVPHAPHFIDHHDAYRDAVIDAAVRIRS